MIPKYRSPTFYNPQFYDRRPANRSTTLNSMIKTASAEPSCSPKKNDAKRETKMYTRILQWKTAPTNIYIFVNAR